MKRKAPRKPTGEVREKVLDLVDGRISLSDIHVFKLPESKNEAEDVVMQKYVRVSQLNPDVIPELASATHFPTDHGPDFETVGAAGSSGYFELVEFAPLVGKYEDFQTTLVVQTITDCFIELINTKIEKYRDKTNFRPISLLIYVSHYRFTPGIHETKVLQDILQELKNDVFDAIYLELFAYDGSPLVVRIWPFSGRHFTRSELTGHLRRQMPRPDHTLTRVVSDNSKGDHIDYTVRVFFPKDTDMDALEKHIRATNDDSFLRFRGN